MSENDNEEKKEETMSVSSIGGILSNFLLHITSLSKTLPLSMNALIDDIKKSVEDFKEFEEKYIIKDHPDLGEDKVLIKADKLQQFNEMMKKIEIHTSAAKNIPCSFIVSLISHYDAFLGNLIKEIYLIKPEILAASERSLSLSQLVKFDSIDEARNYILEKEVESVIRKSHADHFDWMENIFSIPLRKDLEVWPNFVEVTERRNLFVHTGGKVTSQYLKNCRKHNVIFEEEIEVGRELEATPRYFIKAYQVIFEIGLKLAHVLWRKFRPEEISIADRNIIGIGYDTLYEEDYELTKMIFNFATCVLKKHSNEENRKMMIVNRALAYKWSGDSCKAEEIIKKEDWSASSSRFRLAEAVILDDYSTALKIMKEIGDDESEVGRENYRNWPLFKEFRTNEEFIKVFEEIFNEPFSQVHIDKEDFPDANDLEA
jgi:hypothetical protein